MGYSGRGVSEGIGKWIWLYPVIERTLKLCGLKRSDRVVIYTDTNRNKVISDTFFAAVYNFQAEVIEVVSNPGYGGHGENTRQPPRSVIDLMKTCTFVIDLPSNHWAYTEGYNEVLDSGVRILLSCADEDLLVRMVPTEEVIEKTKKGADILTKASRIKITSGAGTDLSLSVKGRKCNAQVGCVDELRPWDHYPSGLTEIAPVEDSANGTLVLAPGDPVVELERLITEPIRIALKDGLIIGIEGGGEAKLLEEWFEQWNDSKVKRFAHIGFGTDHRANLFSYEAMDWESLLGGINVSFGVNTARFLEGKNNARAHIDIVMRHGSLKADEIPVVEKGKLVYL